jgi:hypothetical protein
LHFSCFSNTLKTIGFRPNKCIRQQSRWGTGKGGEDVQVQFVMRPHVEHCDWPSACCAFRSPSIHRPDDGGSKHLWNVWQFLPDNTAQHSRSQSSSYSSPSEPEISPFDPFSGSPILTFLFRIHKSFYFLCELKRSLLRVEYRTVGDLVSGLLWLHGYLLKVVVRAVIKLEA